MEQYAEVQELDQGLGARNWHKEVELGAGAVELEQNVRGTVRV